MRFGKPRLRAKSVNFGFNAKSSNTGYNESCKATPKSLARIGSEKSPVELGVPKSDLLYIFRSTEKFAFYPVPRVV